MAKLKLNPEPTFKAKVGIPVPGRGVVPVEFTFNYRTREQTLEWIEATRNAKDTDSIMDCACAWELDDEFNLENVERFCNSYAGAGFAVVDTYLRELSGARRGN